MDDNDKRDDHGDVAMNDDQYRQLIERAHACTELKRTEGWQAWNQIVNHRVDAKKREMLRGMDTLEGYRYLAGWIEGAEWAIDAIDLEEQRVDREREQRNEAKAQA